MGRIILGRNKEKGNIWQSRGTRYKTYLGSNVILLHVCLEEWDRGVIFRPEHGGSSVLQVVYICPGR